MKAEHKKNTKMKPPRDPEARMTFTEHLAELRVRIIHSAIAIFGCFIVAYIFSNQLLELITAPLRNVEGISWTSLDFLEGFLTRVRISGYCGLAIASPYVIYQVCAFVFPGLKPGERRAVQFLLGGGCFLMIAGVSLAYFGILPTVLPYIVEYNPDFVTTNLQLKKNVTLLFQFYGGFALGFQFPMVVLILVYMDLLSPATLRAYRRLAIVGIFFMAMLFTPPDPFTMLMMGGPLVLLYEVSIWLSYLIVRRRKKEQEQQETPPAGGPAKPDNAPARPKEDRKALPSGEETGESGESTEPDANENNDEAQGEDEYPD